MRNYLSFIIVTFLFISCANNKSEKKAEMSPVKELSSPATDSCAEPYLFTDKNGLIYLSWIEKKGKGNKFKFSTLKNDQWAEPIVIASGNNWFVNWADYPMLVADGNDNLMAHYLEKSDTAKFTYDIKYVTSTEKGESWAASRILHDDGKKAEHGFVSMIPYTTKYFVSWLDGRNTVTEGESHEGHHGQMSLRGAFLATDGNKQTEWELDSRVCDCCQTTTAITANGPIVVYRDRSDDEIRDMSIVRYENGEWTAPKILYPDNWKIAGCPVNGPRADAIGNNLAIAWFSMQDKKGQVKITFSEDGGANFKEPIQIDEGNAIGRVDIVMLDNKTAFVSWMEGASIKGTKVHSDGSKDSSIMIASSSEARSSGFPQMTKSGNTIYFAWTDDKMRRIKVASLSF